MATSSAIVDGGRAPAAGCPPQSRKEDCREAGQRQLQQLPRAEIRCRTLRLTDGRNRTQQAEHGAGDRRPRSPRQSPRRPQAQSAGTSSGPSDSISVATGRLRRSRRAHTGRRLPPPRPCRCRYTRRQPHRRALPQTGVMQYRFYLPRTNRVGDHDPTVDERKQPADQRVECRRQSERESGKDDRPNRCVDACGAGDRHRQQPERRRQRVLRVVPHGPTRLSTRSPLNRQLLMASMLRSVSLEGPGPPTRSSHQAYTLRRWRRRPPARREGRAHGESDAAQVAIRAPR